MKFKLLVGFIICFLCFVTTSTDSLYMDDEGIITYSEVSLSEYLLKGFMKSLIAIILYSMILLFLHKKRTIIKSVL